MIIDFLYLNITEDEYIEHFRCQEQLRKLGFEEEEIIDRILQCNICCLGGRCKAESGPLFTGARTC